MKSYAVQAGQRASAGQATGDRGTVVLLACGVAGPLLFVTGLLAEGATRPGYSPWHNFVSTLSLGDRGYVQVANFLVAGMLSLGFAAGLWRVRAAGRRGAVGPALFAAFGMGLIAAGVFVTDPSLGYPPGTPARVPPTGQGTLHNLAGYTIFVALSAAGLLWERTGVGPAGGRRWGAYSRASGLVVALCFAAGQALAVMEQGGSLAWAPAGLLQRAAIITGAAWSSALAIRLLRARAKGPG